MKRRVYVIVAALAVLALMLTACGGDGSDSSDNGGRTGFGGNPEIDFADIDYSVGLTTVDSYDYAGVQFTNNSEYDIVYMNMDFEFDSDIPGYLKQDLTDVHGVDSEDLEDPDDISISSWAAQYITSGEDSVKSRISVEGFWWEADEDETFDIHPKYLEVYYVSDGTVYKASYSYISEEAEYDEETWVMNKWPDVELAERIPAPENDYWVYLTDEGSFAAFIYDADKSTFEDLVKASKDAGFKEDTEIDGAWWGEDEEGNNVEIDYRKKDHVIELQVETEDNPIF